MAITGTKLFASGDVLTAADTNQYLMRGVKVFSSTAVRDAAYGGAGEPTLEEGETCYITGTDELQTYNGTSWVKMGPAPTAVGKVLQVVSTTKTDTFSTTSNTFTDITGLSATITPSATSSKVLVMAQIGTMAADTTLTQFRISGGNTATAYIGDTAGSRTRAVYQLQGQNLGSHEFSYSFLYLDSPSTTSATTYVVQCRNANSNTIWINRTFTDTDSANFGRGASTITVMEIGV